MNELNYASLEASKKLMDAGIVLETDYYWIRVANSPMMLHNNIHGADDYYPAPSMAEVWRELPETYKTKSGIEYTLQLDKVRRHDGVVVSSVQYVYGNEGQYVMNFFARTNPADALIELLIWVRKEKRNE